MSHLNWPEATALCVFLVCLLAFGCFFLWLWDRAAREKEAIRGADRRPEPDR